MNYKLPVCAMMILMNTITSFAQNHVIDVNTLKTGAAVQNTMYGLFFEDINHAADGGLYGELVKNRSFEFPQNLTGWQTLGKVKLNSDGPFKRCPHYVVLSDPGHPSRKTGIINEGFFGIGIRKDEEYRFTVWAKAPDGPAGIIIQLADQSAMNEKQEIVSTRIDVKSDKWQKYEAVMKSAETKSDACLRIFLDGPNDIYLEHISLFPVNTFKKRENGMREDLALALADIHPGVFRFPGGCIVEGTDLATRYQWKNTIGPVENRPLNENRWQHSSRNRIFPDYYQSGGLGFYEYFLLSEDIGAEPLPVLNVGMACQFQNRNDKTAHVPVNELQPYIDDCLDLIEFANGDTATTWGRKRAEMGHTEPFNLKMIAVGNEQWDTLYFERLEPFVKAIRAKYPEIKIIGTSGPDSEGKKFDIGWAAMKKLKADLVDEHFYRPETWFLSSGLRYDKYDRKGPKVFAGEYACHGKGKKWNHYEASLCEAAFMTNLERNADVVQMTAYAPLFAHTDGWQWRPDLIWYDNLRMFKSASYYVQQMYATNKGTNVLPTTMDGRPVAGQEGQDGLFASSVTDKNKGTIIIKIINTSKQTQSVTINLNGLKEKRYGTTLTLTSDDPDAENTLDNPALIVPQEGKVSTKFGKKGMVIDDELPAMTFRIYRINK